MQQNIFDKVVAGDVEGVKSLVKIAVDSKQNLETIINEGLIKAMDEVGARMRAGDMFVPEVLISAEAMKQGLEIIKPLLGGKMQTKGKVLIGTVAGDLHDIGKNLVAMLLESSGYEIVDLGIDVPTDKFLEAIQQHRPDIVGMSALLTTTMASMEDTVKAVKKQNGAVLTIVGGAPVSQEFADQIGADGYAPDAATAVELCHNLLQKGNGRA